MDNILRLIGMAKKAGQLEIGEEPVGASARARKAGLLLLAEDAASNTVRRAAHFGQAGNVLTLIVPYTKAELGMAVGRSSCAMLALTDSGFAASLAEKLAAKDPEKYGPAAARLGEKARKVLQRQREQRRHEKNLERGKKRPWTPPPKQEEKGKGASPAGKGVHPNRKKKAGTPETGWTGFRTSKL